MYTSPSNKKYIGLTKRTLVERAGTNGQKYQDQPAIWRAIKKYGWENFQKEILYSNLTKEEAGLKEREMISLYRTNEKEFGYNLTDGGEGLPDSHNLSVEKPVDMYDPSGKYIKTFTSIAEAEREMKLSGISPVCLGKLKRCGNFVWRFKGEPFDKYDSSYQIQGKPVVQYDWYGNIIQTFPNAHIAEEKTGIKASTIQQVCTYLKASSGNYVWRYVNEEFNNSKFDYSRHYEIYRYDLHGNLIKIYKNITEANKTKIARISECCKGKCKTAGGSIWRYKGDSFDKHPLPDLSIKNRWWEL